MPDRAPGGSAADRELQDVLRRTASRGRAVERVGPFTATFSPGTDHPYLSYAIPDDGARPTEADARALLAAYRDRGRVPRLEYVPGTAPAVEPVLTAAGFAVEQRLPVLTCRPEGLLEPAAPPGFAIRQPTGAELRGAAEAASEGFGERFDDEQVERLARTLRHGGFVAAAIEESAQRVVGSGAGTPPESRVTELVGIAVVPAFRRRGLGAALTARLAADAFAAGVRLAFLTPADDDAGRIYTRVGFAPVSHLLHLRATEPAGPA